MFIFHIRTSTGLASVIFCILSFSDKTCEIAYENTSVNILFLYFASVGLLFCTRVVSKQKETVWSTN